MYEMLLKKIFVPMFMSTATPMVMRNSAGAIHEVVVRTRIRIITGTRTLDAPSTSVSTCRLEYATLAAFPLMPPSSPISS